MLLTIVEGPLQPGTASSATLTVTIISSGITKYIGFMIKFRLEARERYLCHLVVVPPRHHVIIRHLLANPPLPLR